MSLDIVGKAYTGSSTEKIQIISDARGVMDGISGSGAVNPHKCVQNQSRHSRSIKYGDIRIMAKYGKKAICNGICDYNYTITLSYWNCFQGLLD